MTLPPPVEVSHGDMQKMMAAAVKYGMDIVMPKR